MGPKSSAEGCDVCGEGTYVKRSIARHDAGELVGLEGVTLLGARGQVCDACGAVMLDGETLDRAMDSLSLLLITQDGPLSAGEIRYLRKSLEMTQERLAERLAVHRTTVARWETGEVSIGQAESVAIRALAAMKMVAEQPKLLKEVAAKFMRPVVVRRHGPYEIALNVA